MHTRMQKLVDPVTTVAGNKLGDCVFYLTAHIEVDILADFPHKDMYTLLKIHLEEVFGKDNPMTKFEHSYDSKIDVLRFDLKPEGICLTSWFNSLCCK